MYKIHQINMFARHTSHLVRMVMLGLDTRSVREPTQPCLMAMCQIEWMNEYNEYDEYGECDDDRKGDVE